MKDKLEEGYWILQPPMGYDIVAINGNRDIVVNEVGKKLKFAYEWKAEGMKNQEILEKLEAMGLKIQKQQLGRVLSNPFYCGIITHNFLKGKVVEHKHEKLISKELFLKVNNINVNSHQHGVPHTAEHEAVPLKAFARCGTCGTPFTGYVVKKKNLWYYKCGAKGCRHNRSAKEVNSQFLSLLQKYTLNAKYMEPLQYILENSITEQQKRAADMLKSLKGNLHSVAKKIDTLEERHFILDEISREIYEKFNDRYQQEKTEILNQLEQFEEKSSNPREQVAKALMLSTKLPYLWASSKVKEKERLQKLIFPEGIYFDKENRQVQTTVVNTFFDLIGLVNSDLEENKSEEKSNFPRLSSLVAETGLEPVTFGL